MRAALRIVGLIAVLLGASMPAGAQQTWPPPISPPAPSAGTEAPKPEASKPEPDAAKPEAAKSDVAKSDAAKSDAAKPDAAPGDTQTSICLLLESAARANDLPIEFFARVIWQESRFRADAIGPLTRNGRRAQGIAQFMPGTAAELDLLDPFDPIQALPKSAEFLRKLRREFGNLGLAAAAYNAGPRRVREWIAGSGGMPAETRAYVEAITGASVDRWAKAVDKPGEDDQLQKRGPACGELMALLRRTPNRFFAALEQRVVAGASQPWGVILGADISRDRMMAKYAALQRRHSAVLAGRDPILLERRRGPLPRYQVRIGADTRAAANALCSRIHQRGGDCVVLHNPKG